MSTKYIGRLHENTLTQALAQTAKTVPERGISIYDRRGQNADFRTYPQILELAKTCAQKLASAGFAKNERLLMCLPTSWDLIGIYLGAIFRGVQPVLVAPSTSLGSAAAQTRKLRGLVELITPKRLLCDAALRKDFTDFDGAPLTALSLTPDEFSALESSARSDTGLASPRPEDIAFMQFTSGSTGRQRAVKIHHGAAVHNSRMVGAFAGAPQFGDDSVVSWLPLNHDMGLIGCLFAITQGFDLNLIRPDTFLARPKVWLKVLSDKKSTLSPAPNFGYQLCVERIEEQDLAGIDLSTWRVAFTGAEMVRKDTCENFIRRFGPFGFKPQSFHPCYGMAEATLVVTCDNKKQGLRTEADPGIGEKNVDSSQCAVACTGIPGLDTEVKITAPGQSRDTTPKEGVIGEIWAKGPAIFSGYYNDDNATRESLVDGWLRTGDLGFLKDGELYITGRTKDLLIVNGQNIMPHEIEWIAESVSGGGGAERCGAFSVARDSTGEQAVIVIEISGQSQSPLAGMEREIRVRIGRELGLTLADILFVKRGQIPKTTSGKVQRAELRRRYLDGELERLH